MYFEVYKKGNLIKRGKETLNYLSFDHELMYAPTCRLSLPIEWLDYFDGREEVKIFTNGKVFWGIVWDIEVDKVEETIDLSLRHVVSEWEYRQISVNHAISGADSNSKLNIVYKCDKVKKDASNDETITASDFGIMANQIDKMTVAKWVEKAFAKAWVTSNGDKVDITSVDTSKFKKDKGSYKEGDYDVTFSTKKGTKITVTCTVHEAVSMDSAKTETNKANNETISARPFTVYTDAGYTAEKVKEKVEAKAWVKGHKSQTVSVTSITTNFRNEEGEYEVTASTAKGTKITVKIKVEDGNEYGSTDASVVDKLEDIYTDKNFAYPGWQIDFQDDSATRMIDYVYSKQNKLDALTQTMELTDDLWWRVGWWNEKKIEIGKFGQKKPYILSTKPSGETNIRILQEPKIDYDFENVINVATVYSDKSDSGMASLTLREVYNDKSKQQAKFPVVILRANVNNERDYDMYNAPNQPFKVAPNNELEFAVIDTDSIALEQGTIIEGSFSFNDLNPFEVDSKQITDAKRMQAAETVYKAAIRKLKQSRRSYDITVQVEEIPPGLLPGDRVRLLYDNSIWNMDACSSYWKKILSYDDWFYITKISHDINEYELETNTLTLTKWLKLDRETQVK